MTLKLTIPRAQLKKMQICLKEGGIREIGGWLAAEQIAPGDFKLVGFTVDFEVGTWDHFESVPGSHTEQLDEILTENENRSGRVDYLGEWHSHPTFPPVPSTMDLAAMTNMVENSGPAFAALIIVRMLDTTSIEASITTFQRGQPPAKGRLTFENVRDEIAVRSIGNQQK